MASPPSDKHLRALELGRRGNVTLAQIATRLNSRQDRIRKWLDDAGIPVNEPKPFTRSVRPDRLGPNPGGKKPRSAKS